MIYRFGQFTLEPARLELRHSGQPVDIEPQVFHLLLHLIANRDRVVGKDELLETVWKGRVVSDATLNSRINAVRRSVGDNGKAQKIVRTFAKRGFRFVAEVTEETRRTPDIDRKVEGGGGDGETQLESTDTGDQVTLDPDAVSSDATRSRGSGGRDPEAVVEERRQLTALVCELGFPGGYSGHPDPEEFADALIEYQTACRHIIADFEGFVASARGTTLLVYFGYPQAHEDDAERSVRAALRMLDTVGDMEADEDAQWSVTIGIATGMVVTGDMVGGSGQAELLVLGRTPDIAAGLQESAEPDSIVIADRTYRLVEGMFRCDDLGPVEIPELVTSIDAHRVYGESGAHSRFEAGAERRLTPLIGREEEIGLLLKRWTQASEGEGQVVLLSGDAGLGKSRIATELKSRLEHESHNHLFFYCSPHHKNSALYPCVDALKRFFGLEKGANQSGKLDDLEGRLDDLGLPVPDYGPYLAVLLSLPSDERISSPESSPEKMKRKTIEAMAAVIEAAAGRTPVLIVVEDVHWIDPSTLEFLDLLVEQLRSLRILLVLTSRPDFVSPWTDHAHCTSLALNRLSRHDSTAMVENLTSDQTLPDEVHGDIIEKSDGVPLFLEELVKTVLELNIVRHDGDRYGLWHPRQSLEIPATLHDSLMARLDRLGPAKSVAQLAAVLGRTFRHDLLVEVFPGAREELETSLSKLMQAGLVYRRGLPPDAMYDFKHALLQEEAYRSLVRRTRQDFHRRVARALESLFPDSIDFQPEILAHHYTEAGSTVEAIPLWQRAARFAMGRSAVAEAREHLYKALNLLSKLPESRDREKRELEILIHLGPVLMADLGSASPVIGDNYRRAQELFNRVGTQAQRFPVLWGLWLHHHMAGQIEAALRLANEAIEMAESQADGELLLQAHHLAWTSQMGLANFQASLEHAEQGLSLYDPERHRVLAFTYGGHDPGVCACAQSAIGRWLLGYPDQAVERCRRALELADGTDHPSSKAQALSSNAQLHLLRREPEKALDFADELLAFSTDNELDVWQANGTILRCWAVHEMGDPLEVLDDLREVIRQRQKAGAHIGLSLHLAVLADVLKQTGNQKESETVIEQALNELESSGLRTWESLVYWVKGGIVSERNSADSSASEESYQKSFEIARLLGIRSISLRAATSLASLWLSQGRSDEARDILSSTYSLFTEGFDTPDMKDARTLLDRIG